MSARFGTPSDVDTDAWLTARLVVPDFVPIGWTDIDRTDIFAEAGNAVSSNVLQWLGGITVQVLS